MKTHQFKSDHYGFQIAVPENWSRSPTDFLLRLQNVIKSAVKGSEKDSVDTTFLGPNGRYLHILLTPLSSDEHEPSISKTEEYFDDLAYRQNLYVTGTGTINVANKNHFWATYYRMSLVGQKQLQFFKKYCLFLNRVECLITAGLGSVTPGDKLPTDQLVRDSEELYDKIVASFKSLPG